MYRVCLSLLALGVAAAPAFAQSRFEVQAREKAMQHARDAAVRAAENPDPATQTAEAAAPAAPAEPAPAAPAQAAPAPVR
jgi:hypothetical protein